MLPLQRLLSRALFALPSLAVSIVLTAALPAAAVEPLVPRPVAPEVTWEGTQFVGAVPDGEVFVLRGMTLESYPVVDEVGLGEPWPLTEGEAPASPSVTSDNPIRGAVMGKEGEWVVLHGAELRWFRHGEEEPAPPARGRVSAVALSKGRPVVALVPMPPGVSTAEGHTGPEVLARWSGDDWIPLAEAEDDELEGHGPADLIVPFSSHVTADSEGDLWVARQYSYEIRHHDSGGRELMSVTVGDGEARVLDEDSEEVEEMRVFLAEQGEKMGRDAGRKGKVRIMVNRSRPVIAALADGGDGRLYVLVPPFGDEVAGWSLDRFDVARRSLERVPLEMDGRGSMSMVAGQDGIYLAAFSAAGGRWFLPWTALEEAAWEPVEGLKIDGLDVSAEE